MRNGNTIFRRLAAGIAIMTLATSVPAQAQFYYAAPDLSTPPVTGAEPELQLDLPGATASELRAGLLWHLRVAMNVAALQCDFEPSLLTVSNYNATLAHHKAELADAFTTLNSYFLRTKGGGKRGATQAFDDYNTRVYSSYSTVHAQRDFCLVMSKIGREAIFTDRSNLYSVAQRHLGEVRRALVPTGDQYFTNPGYGYKAEMPSFSKKCWKKDVMREKCEREWRETLAAAKPVQ